MRSLTSCWRHSVRHIQLAQHESQEKQVLRVGDYESQEKEVVRVGDYESQEREVFRVGDSLVLRNREGCFGAVVSQVQPLCVRMLLQRKSANSEWKSATWEAYFEQEERQLWQAIGYSFVLGTVGWLVITALFVTGYGHHWNRHYCNMACLGCTAYSAVAPHLDLILQMKSSKLRSGIVGGLLRSVALFAKWIPNAVVLSIVVGLDMVFLLGTPWQIAIISTVLMAALLLRATAKNGKCFGMAQLFYKAAVNWFVIAIALCIVSATIPAWSLTPTSQAWLSDVCWWLTRHSFYLSSLWYGLRVSYLHAASCELYYSSDWWHADRFQEGPALFKHIPQLQTTRPMQRRLFQIDEKNVPAEVRHGVSASIEYSSAEPQSSEFSLEEAPCGREILPVHERLSLFFNAGWANIDTVPPCVGKPDEGDIEHLLMGVTELTLISILAYLGAIFREQTCSKHPSLPCRGGLPPITCPLRSHGDRRDVLSFIPGAFPQIDTTEQLCGYEVCDDVKSFLKMRKWYQVSILEAFVAMGLPGIGLAGCFLSHWQGETVGQSLKAMRLGSRTRRFFVDYLCIRQLAKCDFVPDTVEKVIRTIGCTVLLCDPVPDPNVLSRIWCVYEVSCSSHKDVKLQIQPLVAVNARVFRRSMEFINHLETASVQIEDAAARKPEDKRLVLEHCKKSGGVKAINQAVSELLAAEGAVLQRRVYHDVITFYVARTVLAMVIAGAVCFGAKFAHEHGDTL